MERLTSTRSCEFAFKEGEEDFELKGDPRLLRLALRQLLDNAMRHGNGSPIELEEGPGARLTFRQDGPVPDEAFLKKIRQDLQQEKEGPWMDASLGLGLLLARQIAWVHGGAIDLHHDESGCWAATFDMEGCLVP